MPYLPVNGTEIITRMDNWVKAFGADPLTALKTFDFKTVGLVGAGIFIAVILIDLIGYMFAAFSGNRRSYVPYSRSAVDYVTDAWDNRQSNHIGEYYDPYARSRSLEPLTGVLDALSSAWQTWGDDDSLPGAPLGNQWQSDVRHRQSADKPFIFSQ